MDCPDCGGRTVAFRVPAALRDFAPGGGDAARICSVCLGTSPADGDADPPSDARFDAVADFFPDGEAGVALALALGLLDSLALRRGDVVALCEAAERAGADVLLTLDRLAVAGSVDARFDVDRRRRQLAQFL
jgi:hypothetical protein